MLLPDSSLPWEIIAFNDDDFSIASVHGDETEDDPDAGTVVECWHSNGEGLPCSEVDAAYIVLAANSLPTAVELLTEAAEKLDSFGNTPVEILLSRTIREFLLSLDTPST